MRRIKNLFDLHINSSNSQENLLRSSTSWYRVPSRKAKSPPEPAVPQDNAEEPFEKAQIESCVYFSLFFLTPSLKTVEGTGK